MAATADQPAVTASARKGRKCKEPNGWKRDVPQTVVTTERAPAQAGRGTGRSRDLADYEQAALTPP